MTVQQFHKDIEFLLDKSQSGYFPPEEIMNMAHLAQMDRFNFYKQQLIENDTIHAALNPFREVLQFTPSNFTGDGHLTAPAGFTWATALYIIGFDNARMVPTTQKVPFYKDDELPDALASQVRPVTSNTPVAVQGDAIIRFYPGTVFSGKLHYLRQPAKPVYNYTGSRRPFVFNPVGSVDPEWSDTYILPVILKTLELLGVNLNNPEIVQYAAAKTMQP